jgi:pimeloyl-ACP methyl ester carboxylesterase
LRNNIPIYYIVGENDRQTPSVLTQAYIQSVHAPYKQIYTIPNAGHMPMVDQPMLFLDVLSEIKNRQEHGEEA